ncbi:hypothetical protein DFJ77DRAFT_445429 [Powellomyces hirtus]|nr:hypothetical protein DFJ77DRAFT_445429 [Powellomyces hirtus]
MIHGRGAQKPIAATHTAARPAKAKLPRSKDVRAELVASTGGGVLVAAGAAVVAVDRALVTVTVDIAFLVELVVAAAVVVGALMEVVVVALRVRAVKGILARTTWSFKENITNVSMSFQLADWPAGVDCNVYIGLSFITDVWIVELTLLAVPQATIAELGSFSRRPYHTVLLLPGRKVKSLTMNEHPSRISAVPWMVKVLDEFWTWKRSCTMAARCPTNFVSFFTQIAALTTGATDAAKTRRIEKSFAIDRCVRLGGKNLECVNVSRR